MASAPLLHGYVATQLKPAPAEQILGSDQGEPILARWRVGLGYALAWTSDVKNNWAVDWLRWGSFGRFWGQLTREHMRRKDRRELDMEATVVGDRGRVRVDGFLASGAFDNAMESRLIVTGPLPSDERRELPLSQIAPGRYGADFPLDGFGSFLVRAEHARRDDDGELQSVGVSFAQLSRPYPREYEQLAPNHDLLERLALSGGGQFDADVQWLFDPADESVATRRSLWQPLIWIAMACLLLDLLMRRVRIFDRGFRHRGQRSRGVARAR
jgi:hypothetical protein